MQHLLTILVQIMCQPQNMPLKCHMCKLLNVYQWEIYANIYATYELNGINHVTRIAVHRL